MVTSNNSIATKKSQTSAKKIVRTVATAPSKNKSTPMKKAPAKAPLKPVKTVTPKAVKSNPIAKAIGKNEAPAKHKKVKVIRDSFTIPKNEYSSIETLKLRAVRLLKPAKKSELLRAGLKLLESLNDKEFAAALAAVPNIKTGRPSHK